MKKIIRNSVIILLLSFTFCSKQENSVNFQTTVFNLELKKDGSLSFKSLLNDTVDYTSSEEKSYLLQVKHFNSDSLETPKKLSWSQNSNSTTLEFEFSECEAKVQVLVKENYITVELLELENQEKVELVKWGNFNVTLNDKIAQTIGVAYDNEFAIGLMGLNIKSRGGFEIQEKNRLNKSRERFGNAAQRTENGAVLQGFTRNRSVSYIKNTLLQEQVNVLPLNEDDPDRYMVGSKFAIYGIASDNIKKLIPIIEEQEGLPYFTHKGEWQKATQWGTSMRFIMGFNPDNIDKCIEIASMADVKFIYHPGPFQTWGNFQFKKSLFPDSVHSMKLCVDKAKEKGIFVGVHGLSNFITKSDKWVKPIPNSGLVLAGITNLLHSISDSADSIVIVGAKFKSAYDKDELSPLKHNENKNRETFSIRIGDEIIEYSSVTEQGDNLILQKCKRGAYGTIASAHAKGDTVGRLVSHYYKVFFPTIQLQDEMAKNLADIFNKTGLKRFSFDGLEGGLASGHGRYGCDRFVDVFYQNLEDKNVLSSSSDLSHWAWHYISSESWGEPWWAKGFRESHLGHRLEVQEDLEQDFMPRKMGQFKIDKNTSFKDIQWVMGLCAGLDAGLDFYVSPNFMEEHPEAEKILYEIKKWEKARYEQSLTEEQKNILKDPLSIYAINDSGSEPKLIFVESWLPGSGKIQSDEDRNTLKKNIFDTKNGVISLDYKHVNIQKEPGAPTCAEWDYTCKKVQNLQFVIRLPKSEGPVNGIYLKVGATKIDIPFTLEAGEYVCTRNKELIHFSKQDKVISKLPYEAVSLVKGVNSLLFDYKGKGRVAGPEVIVNFYSEKK